MKTCTKRITLLTLSLLLLLAASAQTVATDFMKRLSAIPGVSQVQRLDTDKFQEKYVLKFRQFVDGDNADKGTFDERIFVGFKGYDRPTVLVTEGYYAHYGERQNYSEELCQLFNANVVLCEYRYFGESVPQPTNWDYLTVDNSLRDYHRVRQALAGLFTGKWIATGVSKGGQTTMFYRATYPDDVDVSVSYVAPLNRAVEDGRHEKFLEKTVGTPEERAAILQAQQQLMQRKASIMPLFNKYCKEKGYQFYTSNEDIYDYCVLEYPFALWQWGTPVSAIPSGKATDQEWFDSLMKMADPEYFSYPNKYMPFDLQAVRELGYYGYSLKPIKKWTSLKSTKDYLRQLMLPGSLRRYQFDESLYNRTVKFLKQNDPKHIFIYGENDPWSASGVCTWLDCKKKQNMRIYIQPRGSHRARIKNMPEEMKREIIDRLSGWLQ